MKRVGDGLWRVVRTKSGKHMAAAPGLYEDLELVTYCAGGEAAAKNLARVFNEDAGLRYPRSSPGVGA